MTDSKSNDEYSDRETAERLDRALRRALKTAPKPHQTKQRPASKGRVRKGKNK
jgi:hypothetical protein